jgi:hypothetical protein
MGPDPDCSIVHQISGRTGDAQPGARWHRWSVLEQRIQRRIAAPIALLAALALAAGGGSGRLPIGSSIPRAAMRPAPVHLEHIELVALRAQSTPAEVAR